MQPRISMITLGVTDLVRSVEFYRDGLGWPQLESPPTVAFFTLNGSWLGLFPRDRLAAEAGVPAERSGFSGISLSHNVASEAQVDTLLEFAVNAGATLRMPAGKMHWGGYSGYFRDPDDYLWEVCYNPYMWVGPPDSGD